jgi:hypothetical protein
MSTQEELINTYKSKVAELKGSIKVQWAVDENADQLSEYAKKYITESFVIVRSNCATLLNEAVNGADPELFWDQPRVRNERILKVIRHWEEGQFMDPPEAFVDDNCYLRIRDGRHRLLVAHHLSHETAPVVVPRHHLKAYRLCMRMYPLDEQQSA